MTENNGSPLINLVVLSNDSLYLRSLMDLIETLPSMRIDVAPAVTTYVAEAIYRGADVMLLDIENISNGELMHALQDMTANLPHVKIIFVCDVLVEEVLAQAIPHNVYGILSKTITPVVYEKAVRAVLAGEIWLKRITLTALLKYLIGRSSGFSDDLLHDASSILTDREKEIFALVAKGLSNKEVAKQVSLSPVTVKTHLHNIFEKLQIRRRSEIMLKSSHPNGKKSIKLKEIK